MSPHLLIVDDTAEQLKKIRRAAKEAGFQENQIFGTMVPEEAEARLAIVAFDVAVVDLVLIPNSNDPKRGFELIELIRRTQPDCRIIALTREPPDKDFGIRALLAGAQDFVCTKWAFISWEELLVQRLRLWRGVTGDPHKTTSPA